MQVQCSGTANGVPFDVTLPIGPEATGAEIAAAINGELAGFYREGMPHETASIEFLSDDGIIPPVCIEALTLIWDGMKRGVVTGAVAPSDLKLSMVRPAPEPA